MSSRARARIQALISRRECADARGPGRCERPGVAPVERHCSHSVRARSLPQDERRQTDRRGCWSRSIRGLCARWVPKYQRWLHPRRRRSHYHYSGASIAAAGGPLGLVKGGGSGGEKGSRSDGENGPAAGRDSEIRSSGFPRWVHGCTPLPPPLAFLLALLCLSLWRARWRKR